MTFQNAYCNCTGKYMVPNWCEYWPGLINKSFCVLNGGLTSKFCPEATRLIIDGTEVDDYISSDASICNKSARKLFDTA